MTAANPHKYILVKTRVRFISMTLIRNIQLAREIQNSKQTISYLTDNIYRTIPFTHTVIILSQNNGKQRSKNDAITIIYHFTYAAHLLLVSIATN